MTKALHTVKVLFALLLMVGVPIVGLSVGVLDMGHAVWLTPICYLDAFLGTALLFGLQGFKSRPKFIGNIDNNRTMPVINQNWAVFFITLIINLTIANLCG